LVAELFYVKQQENEPLKNYLNHFCKILIRAHPPNEEMLVDAFIKGLRANPLANRLFKIKLTLWWNPK